MPEGIDTANASYGFRSTASISRKTLCLARLYAILGAMTKVFLSYSSKDRDFVRQLAEDIRSAGHDPWLDEWEIYVGDSIPSKVEEGLRDSQYVVVVLSPHAVASGWVEREWKARYWSDIDQRRAVILPLLKETCDPPILLKDKKYADFREDYDSGLAEVLAALSGNRRPMSRPLSYEVRSQGADLLPEVLNRSIPASTSVAKVLAFATRNRLTDLAQFCTHELCGWDTPTEAVIDVSMCPARHRLIECFVSTTHRINPSYMGWGNDMTRAIAYMRSSQDFKQVNIFYNRPLMDAEMEVRRGSSGSALLMLSFPARFIAPNVENQSLNVTLYGRGDALAQIIEQVRMMVVDMLTKAISA